MSKTIRRKRSEDETVFNGKDYVATVRLSEAGGATVAEAGETCERVNVVSLPWLIEQGLIVRSN